MGIVLVEIRDIYGRETIYPANDAAKMFAALVKQKTLLPAQLSIIKMLGYTIKTKQRELT